MRTKLFLILICLFIFALPTFAQTKEAQKIDEFGDSSCDEAKARLEKSAIDLRNETEAKIYLIFYGGERYKYYIYDKKVKGYKEMFLPPKRNEAYVKVLHWKIFLQKFFPSDKVILLNGGYREEHTVEVWLVPKGVEPPKPTPTLERKDIKFRKGKARYEECQT